MYGKSLSSTNVKSFFKVFVHGVLDSESSAFLEDPATAQNFLRTYQDFRFKLLESIFLTVTSKPFLSGSTAVFLKNVRFMDTQRLVDSDVLRYFSSWIKHYIEEYSGNSVENYVRFKNAVSFFFDYSPTIATVKFWMDPVFALIREGVANRREAVPPLVHLALSFSLRILFSDSMGSSKEALEYVSANLKEMKDLILPLVKERTRLTPSYILLNDDKENGLVDRILGMIEENMEGATAALDESQGLNFDGYFGWMTYENVHTHAPVQFHSLRYVLNMYSLDIDPILKSDWVEIDRDVFDRDSTMNNGDKQTGLVPSIHGRDFYYFLSMTLWDILVLFNESGEFQFKVIGTQMHDLVVKYRIPVDTFNTIATITVLQYSLAMDQSPMFFSKTLIMLSEYSWLAWGTDFKFEAQQRILNAITYVAFIGDKYCYWILRRVADYSAVYLMQIKSFIYNSVLSNWYGKFKGSRPATRLFLRRVLYKMASFIDYPVLSEKLSDKKILADLGISEAFERMDGAAVEESSDYQKIYGLVSAKIDKERNLSEVLNYVLELEDEYSSVPDVRKVVLGAFIFHILNKSQKSYSHVFISLSKSVWILKRLSSGSLEHMAHLLYSSMDYYKLFGENERNASSSYLPSIRPQEVLVRLASFGLVPPDSFPDVLGANVKKIVDNAEHPKIIIRDGAVSGLGEWLVDLLSGVANLFRIKFRTIWGILSRDRDFVFSDGDRKNPNLQFVDKEIFRDNSDVARELFEELEADKKVERYYIYNVERIQIRQKHLEYLKKTIYATSRDFLRYMRKVYEFFRDADLGDDSQVLFDEFASRYKFELSFAFGIENFGIDASYGDENNGEAESSESESESHEESDTSNDEEEEPTVKFMDIPYGGWEFIRGINSVAFETFRLNL